jgi:uncharacterized protein YraI
MVRLITAALTALVWFSLAGATVAAQIGTHAWTRNAVTLYDGPGTEYDVVGDLADAIEVRVERCEPIWCRVSAGNHRGWMYRLALSFGQTDRGPLEGPKHNYGSGAGTVCLYTGPNYTGESFCRNSGFVMRDMKLYGVDNLYSSVTIEGNTSVLLCRDRQFRSYCERVNASQPNLHGFLSNNVSSLHIY